MNIMIHNPCQSLQGGSSMRVAVLECRGWEDEYGSKSRRILIDLVQEAKIEERTHPTGRILVLSRFDIFKYTLFHYELIPKQYDSTV